MVRWSRHEDVFSRDFYQTSNAVWKDLFRRTGLYEAHRTVFSRLGGQDITHDYRPHTGTYELRAVLPKPELSLSILRFHIRHPDFYPFLMDERNRSQHSERYEVLFQTTRRLFHILPHEEKQVLVQHLDRMFSTTIWLWSSVSSWVELTLFEEMHRSFARAWSQWDKGIRPNFQSSADKLQDLLNLLEERLSSHRLEELEGRAQDLFWIWWSLWFVLSYTLFLHRQHGPVTLYLKSHLASLDELSQGYLASKSPWPVVVELPRGPVGVRCYLFRGEKEVSVDALPLSTIFPELRAAEERGGYRWYIHSIRPVYTFLEISGNMEDAEG